MGMFSSMDISASALSAERQRAEVAATNLANVDTTHTSSGTGPYRRREVVLQSTSASPFQSLLSNVNGAATESGDVRLTRVVQDNSEPVRHYDPGNPDADREGYVAYPDINPAQEMVDLMGSVRAYQLNASAVSASKQIIQQSIDVLKS